MIDIKKYYYDMGNVDINMMLFGDLHYSDKFNDKKLDLIYNELISSEYIFIAGDILDSTDVVNNIDKRDKLIKFLEKVGKKHKVFITLGNHDLAIRKGYKGVRDDNNEFWLEVSRIDGIYLSRYNNYYEDDKIIVYLLEQDYDYYYKNKHESKELLLDRIKKDKRLNDIYQYSTNTPKGEIVIIVLQNRELMEYLSRVASKLSKSMWVSNSLLLI